MTRLPDFGVTTMVNPFVLVREVVVNNKAGLATLGEFPTRRALNAAKREETRGMGRLLVYAYGNFEHSVAG